MRSANTNDDSRLDIEARDFWTRDQTAFFDIRVTYVGSQSNKNQKTAVVFRQHELAKKREYMQRVLDVEQGSFTPLVFGSNGGMGNECRKFTDELSRQLATKQNETYSDVVSWLRVRLSMEIVRSTILCVRGSRTPFRRNENIAEDIRLENVESGVF